MKVLSKEEIELIKNQIIPGATDAQLSLFVTICNRYELDPFIGDIAALPFKIRDPQSKKVLYIRYSFMITRDGYLKIAKRDPNYMGVTSFIVCENDFFEMRPGTGEIEHIIKTRDDTGKIIGRGKLLGAWAKAQMFNPIAQNMMLPSMIFCDLYHFGKKEYDEKSGTMKLAETWANDPIKMYMKEAERLALKKIVNIDVDGDSNESSNDEEDTEILPSRSVIPTEALPKPSTPALLPAEPEKPSPKIEPPKDEPKTQIISSPPSPESPKPSLPPLNLKLNITPAPTPSPPEPSKPMIKNTIPVSIPPATSTVLDPKKDTPKTEEKPKDENKPKSPSLDFLKNVKSIPNPNTPQTVVEPPKLPNAKKSTSRKEVIEKAIDALDADIKPKKTLKHLDDVISDAQLTELAGDDWFNSQTDVRDLKKDVPLFYLNEVIVELIKPFKQIDYKKDINEFYMNLCKGKSEKQTFVELMVTTIENVKEIKADPATPQLQEISVISSFTKVMRTIFNKAIPVVNQAIAQNLELHPTLKSNLNWSEDHVDWLCELLQKRSVIA